MDGFLSGCRYLIHDRASVFTSEFQMILEAAGVKSVRLPPRSPNLNAFAERFVRSIKEECLSRVVVLGEGSLRRAVDQFCEHYHRERNHQGLENRIIEPAFGLNRAGEVQVRQRLGGLLHYYYRDAA
jgi:putative transposase